jgi:hypothetical protein
MKRLFSRDERGQTLPLFAIFLVVMLAAAGLVIDVGSAWAQERGQQKAADVAALAGATAEANGATNAQIKAAALASATANGYDATEVEVNIPPTEGKYGPGGSGYSSNACTSAATYPCWVEVKITKEHPNSFARIIGQTEWDVAGRGVAVGGIANAVSNGISPIMFNVDAVQAGDRGNNKQYCNPQSNRCDPNNTWPLGETQFNWTTFCVTGGNCNVNSADAKNIIDGGGFQITVALDMYLGPHNHGQHTSVCHALMDFYPNGGDLPVAINDDNGNLAGFWIWHFDAAGTDCNGPDGEIMSGWFLEDLTSTLPLTISPDAPAATFGQWIVRLVE